ncbi:hypothetical protein EYF80_014394 [Liparis tanakae]|uniref:Uncharacterized protein n=1 Tax=Liparis tanakae TaxID=230148 RepID=A0A4Z2IBJ8_9TELE|nr:hypothetical protein EYF80_014394 [Liparis tanakae]
MLAGTSWAQIGNRYSVKLNTADNEPVMPTHSSLINVTLTVSPVLLSSGLRWSTKPPAEKSSWEVCVGGGEVNKREQTALGSQPEDSVARMVTPIFELSRDETHFDKV